MNWTTFQDVGTLPDTWEHLAADNIFLHKDFLAHLESVNPCQQAYYVLESNGDIKAIYVDYSIYLDIFTYSFAQLKIPVRIMGIPCSVAKQGFAVMPGYEEMLTNHFFGRSGAKLILNCESILPANRGITLPTCRLDIRFPSFEDFILSMRSHYRYRVKKAMLKGQEVTVEFLPLNAFDREMYSLYEQVFNNSPAKLEKLPFEFFNKLPLPAVLIKTSLNGSLLGFSVIVENGEELLFLFTGFDYRQNSRFDIYFNLLLEVIKYGLKGGFKVIDLGQTAEDTKLKLGSRLVSKAMYFSHSNSFINFLSKRLIDLLSYKEPNNNFRVFK